MNLRFKQFLFKSIVQTRFLYSPFHLLYIIKIRYELFCGRHVYCIAS